MTRKRGISFYFLLHILLSTQLLYSFLASITEVPGQPFLVGVGSAPISVAYSPNGKWCATANIGTNSVSFFAVDSLDGSLAEIAGSPLSEINLLQANSVIYSPDSKFLAVTSYGVNLVTIYTVDQTTGALSNPLSYYNGIPLSGPCQVLYSPNGKFLTVVSRNAPQALSVFEVNQTTGELTLYNSTFLADTISFGGGSTQIAAYSPDGAFFSCACTGQDGTGRIAIFSVNPQTGELSNQETISIDTAPSGMAAIAYSPDGSLIGATDIGNTLYIFSVNSLTGQLTLLSTTTTPGGIDDQEFGSFSPDGQFFVVANSMTNALYVYSVNPQTGVLTPFGSLLPTGTFPYGITAFSPITTSGFSFCSTPNTTDGTLTSYKFSLCPPIGAITINPPIDHVTTVGSITTITGTLSVNGNTVTVTSSDPSVILVSNVSVNGTHWTARLIAKSAGYATVTAIAKNCSLVSPTQSATATYVVLSDCDNTHFSCKLFSAIHKKYFPTTIV